MEELRQELVIYSKNFANELMLAGVSYEEAINRAASWVERTCDFYSDGDYDLKSVAMTYAFLNNAKAMKQQGNDSSRKVI